MVEMSEVVATGYWFNRGGELPGEGLKINFFPLATVTALFYTTV